MPTTIRDGVLQRLLISKQFLTSGVGQVTSDSDAVVIAKMILSAHDAAELAAAAIADQLEIPGISEKSYLMDYLGKLKEHDSDKPPFSGIGFFRQLNTVRNSFKHGGIIPNPRDWYRVLEKTWNWVDILCQTYLNISLSEIDLEQLISDATIKNPYQRAKSLYRMGQYKEALEYLGKALYYLLEACPAVRSPLIRSGHWQNTNDALMLATFGVRPSEFLSLRDFLPSVRKDAQAGQLICEWNRRETGHRANWTERNVRFCLEAFIDIALKIQHAQWHPRPVEYVFIFDDVIRALADNIELWENETEGIYPFIKVTGKKVVMYLQKGEELRCMLSSVEEKDGIVSGLSPDRPTIEAAKVLAVWSDRLPHTVAYIETKDIEISSAPKEDDFVKKYFPYLFAQ